MGGAVLRTIARDPGFTAGIETDGSGKAEEALPKTKKRRIRTLQLLLGASVHLLDG